MAMLEHRPTVTVDVTLRLSEEEAAALAALAGYGDDAFLKVFYAHLGEVYLKPHERGLLSLFKGVRNGLPGILQRAAAARKAFVHGVSPDVLT